MTEIETVISEKGVKLKLAKVSENSFVNINQINRVSIMYRDGGGTDVYFRDASEGNVNVHFNSKEAAHEYLNQHFEVELNEA